MHKHEWYISVMKGGEVFARCKDPDCEIILADYRIDRCLDVHSALRTVARVSQLHNDACVSYDCAIEQALDALPPWVLEANDEDSAD